MAQGHNERDATMADHIPIEHQLVDDRELTDSTSDRFRHADVVDQLADLIVTAPTPSSIALFAPWGSGKSSIFNLLDQQLRSVDPAIRLIRYDAFRYAKLPLQRHFLRSLGRALDLDSQDFDDGLYEGTQSNSIRFGDGKESTAKAVWQLVRVFAWVIGLALILALVLLAAIAVIATATSETLTRSDFGDTLFDLAKSSLVGFVAPAGLLALVSTVGGKSLWVTRQRSAPTSEEEFGEKFESLVKAAVSPKKYRRLAVFVDELDRCTPETVVETLDSLRTFLGAKDCVFIVAADQAVLEEALTRRVKQATPLNRSNPYYSSGSEYLDKTFHYQMQIPPLLPKRLSGFAATLVRDKPGVWETVHSVDAVVSVLIPNHVRSPRRAKTLLNSFALAYDLASRRMAVEHIADDLPSRGRELAFLTCLRVEFPLLAAELQQHPSLIAALRTELGLPGGSRGTHSDDATRLAKQFLAGLRPTDQALAVDRAASHLNESGGPADEPIDSDADNESAHEAPDAAVESPTATDPEARHLELYLRKTARVPMPRQDLIHLEGSGARLGLDAHLADELENAGSQGDIDAVRDVLDRLGDSQIAGIRAIAESLDRDAAPLGEEASNLATTLLQIYAERADLISPDDRTRLANQCSAAIDAHLEAYELRDSDLAGALALGLDSGSDYGTSLARSVLAHDGVETQVDVATTLLTRLSAAETLSPSQRDRVFAHALAGDTALEQLAKGFAEAPAPVGTSLLEGALPTLSRLLEPPPSAEDEDEETAKANSRERRSRHARLIDAFLEFEDRRDLSQIVSLGILNSDSVDARNVVVARLESLAESSSGLVDNDQLASSLVVAASKRSLTDMSSWLVRVPPDRSSDTERQAIDKIATKAWKDRAGTESAYSDLFDQLTRILASPLGPESSVSEAIASELGVVQNSAVADLQQVIRSDYLEFTDAGLLEASSISEAVRERVSDGFSAAIPAQHLVDGKVADFHGEVAVWVVNNGGWDAERPLSETISECTWMEPLRLQQLAIDVAAIEADEHGLSTPPINHEQLLALIGDHGPSVGTQVARWVRHFSAGPAEAFETLDILFDAGTRVEGDVRDAIVSYAQSLDENELFEFLGPELEKIRERDCRSDFLAAARYNTLPSNTVATTLTNLFEAAANNEQRARVLDLWSAHGMKDMKARQSLFETVLYPFAELNSSALDSVLRRHDLIATAPNRKEVRRRLASAGDRFGRRSHADKSMAKAGLKRKRRLSDLLGGQAVYDDID